DRPVQEQRDDRGDDQWRPQDAERADLAVRAEVALQGREEHGDVDDHCLGEGTFCCAPVIARCLTSPTVAGAPPPGRHSTRWSPVPVPGGQPGTGTAGRRTGTALVRSVGISCSPDVKERAPCPVGEDTAAGLWLWVALVAWRVLIMALAARTGAHVA